MARDFFTSSIPVYLIAIEILFFVLLEKRAYNMTTKSE